MPKFIPIRAQTDEQIERCFPVMSELRTHLRRELFLAQIRLMEDEGYRLAYIEEDKEVVSVAGFRIYTNLFMGKNLYVDDLVTSERHRSKRHGETMLAWLRKTAIDNDCRYLHLDSGTQRHRAHRFYFRQGLNIASYHFSEALKAT